MHIYFKTVFQSALEHAIFIQKIENFRGRGTVSSPDPRRPAPKALRSSRLRRSTHGLPIQNPRHGLRPVPGPIKHRVIPYDRGVYDHTELRSERIKILRGDFLGTQDGLWKV